ncbi:copia-type polyprotein [Trifolium pratense]|uniref:Copia-type polyprotein n=1 Tax=Trifolium pratense TaxID=57577 RepID=A0A2K3NIN5_TRIPR|nr:copia-type polyprotein [Trifolium pratense]
MKPNLDKEEEQALKVSNYGGRGANRGRGGRSSSRERGRGRQISKENIECFRCHKLGHYQSECPNWEDANANFVEFDDKEEILLMAQGTDESNDKKAVWYLDSGCSNHMVGNKEWLFDFDVIFRESVKLGDDSKMAVMGKGNLKLNINGMVQARTDVYFLPGLKNNLLSIGQLQQKNVTIIFEKDQCRVFHDK